MNKTKFILKLIGYFYIGILTVGGIIWTAQYLYNNSKYNDSKPPYILENKIYDKKMNTYTFYLRQVDKSYKEHFTVDVGKFTFDSYEIGNKITEKL